MSGSLNAEADRLLAAMQTGGAQVFETTILQPSDVLLDLYGENIHARAFVTSDPVLGAQMLRPDFTVPIVQQHMTDGAEPARYCYKGVVFRKQSANSDKPNEILQVGYELFDGANPAVADAEVFELFYNMLSGFPVRPVVGDIGILKAVIDGLDTSSVRRAALLRHIWRPSRFSELLNRFAVPRTGEGEAVKPDAPHIGLRSLVEIEDRLQLLAQNNRTAPIPKHQIDAIGSVLGIDAPAPAALDQLRDVAGIFPTITPAVERLAERLDALSARGIEIADLTYLGSYGRQSLEYYDGFVFGFYGGGEVVASGGRYDALTEVLGQGRGIPAVGGVIRPAQVLALKEGHA